MAGRMRAIHNVRGRSKGACLIRLETDVACRRSFRARGWVRPGACGEEKDAARPPGIRPLYIKGVHIDGGGTRWRSATMKRIGLVVLCLVLAGCASDHPRHRHVETFHPPIEILQRYDADHNGFLTRAELEAGIRADFA